MCGWIALTNPGQPGPEPMSNAAKALRHGRKPGVSAVGGDEGRTVRKAHLQLVPHLL